MWLFTKGLLAIRVLGQGLLLMRIAEEFCKFLCNLSTNFVH